MFFAVHFILSGHIRSWPHGAAHNNDPNQFCVARFLNEEKGVGAVPAIGRWEVIEGLLSGEKTVDWCIPTYSGHLSQADTDAILKAVFFCNMTSYQQRPLSLPFKKCLYSSCLSAIAIAEVYPDLSLKLGNIATFCKKERQPCFWCMRYDGIHTFFIYL